MIGGAALPRLRLRTRSRRRRLPRLPKFTRWQKLTLAFYCLMMVYGITRFVIEQALVDLMCAAGWMAYIHSIFVDALRPPRGGCKSMHLGSGCFVLGTVVALGGIG